ncbi:hypothetical protein CON15_19210 [Bacillus cereus]|uniref:Uncharacterized protein n=2 Tax=Bacillus thuringiensis TaxID=1428 RepID=A0A9X6U4F0_BACTU|nr:MULTISPECIES: hypothetical protein [Bacillus cereus group]MDO6628744.1 hypothetical protein [Bacillus thuringiensis]MDO6698917.1 hypothetical protein [Bacillus thuringiensis]PDZ55670.1 hypothetical protein CON15_19210 [Bacillus cereus]PED16337.1 hypothetical protein CON01_00375 [Bacillus thuringiensis]PFO26254.1 hypothetical protein COJ78_29565 [Bacillus thuringiensis]
MISKKTVKIMSAVNVTFMIWGIVMKQPLCTFVNLLGMLSNVGVLVNMKKEEKTNTNNIFN